MPKRIKRLPLWIVLSAITAVLVVGCGFFTGNHSNDAPVLGSTDQSASNCRVVEHDVGKIQICGQPQKVAALSTYTLNLLLSLNQQPAGYATTLSLHPGEVFDDPVQQIPYVGDQITGQPMNLGKSGEPSLEKLVALEPDLIVTERAQDYELLSQIAPTLLCQNRGLKGQWQESLRSLAIALGNGDPAETVIQQHEANLAKARADLADSVAAHPRLLLLVAHRLDQGVGIIGADSDLGGLLSQVGFQVMSQPPASLNVDGPISMEALPTLDDADSIVVLGYDLSGDRQQKRSTLTHESASERTEQVQVQPIKESWEANEIAQSLTASQKNRVFFATFYKWHGLTGPIGAELVLEQLRQFFLDNASPE